MIVVAPPACYRLSETTDPACAECVVRPTCWPHEANYPLLRQKPATTTFVRLERVTDLVYTWVRPVSEHEDTPQ